MKLRRVVSIFALTLMMLFLCNSEVLADDEAKEITFDLRGFWYGEKVEDTEIVSSENDVTITSYEIYDNEDLTGTPLAGTHVFTKEKDYYLLINYDLDSNKYGDYLDDYLIDYTLEGYIVNNTSVDYDPLDEMVAGTDVKKVMFSDKVVYDEPVTINAEFTFTEPKVGQAPGTGTFSFDIDNSNLKYYAYIGTEELDYYEFFADNINMETLFDALSDSEPSAIEQYASDKYVLRLFIMLDDGIISRDSTLKVNGKEVEDVSFGIDFLMPGLNASVDYDLTENPKTIDNVLKYTLIIGISLAGMVALGICLKKRYN